MNRIKYLLTFSFILMLPHAQAEIATKYMYAKDTATPMITKPSEIVGKTGFRPRQPGQTRGLGFAFGREWVFANNAEMMTEAVYDKSNGLTGSDFMAALKDYSKKACIPTLLMGGHGWGSPLAGNGISTDVVAKGSIYRDADKGFYLTGKKRASVYGSLKSGIADKSIRFCSECEIYMHACSISKDFGTAIAKTTGCRVIAADYKVSPVDPGLENLDDNGSYDHVWFTSGKGNFYEYLSNGKRKIIGQSFIFDPSFLNK